MTRLPLFALIFLSFAAVAFAQDERTSAAGTASPPATKLPKPISGGVLNGKATSLPKPPYPPAARAVGASGAVSVQVLIDEDGNVVSATALSGHPLLRAAAAEAARQAKFAPTTLQGMPVKVSGVITYNFVGALYPAKMGYTLAYAVESGDFESGTNPKSLASQLPSDWTEEIEALNELTFEKRDPAPVKPPPATTAEKSTDKNRYTILGDVNFSAASSRDKLDTRSMASVRNVIPKIASRLQVNESALWSFELGQALAKLVAHVDDAGALAANISTIESLLQRVPERSMTASVQRVREFVMTTRTPPAEGWDVRQQAQMLSNLRY